jgi:hypothetical protein
MASTSALLRMPVVPLMPSVPARFFRSDINILLRATCVPRLDEPCKAPALSAVAAEAAVSGVWVT